MTNEATEVDEPHERIIVVLFSGNPYSPLGSISHPLFCRVRDQLHDKLNEIQPESPLPVDVWIDSPGGDAHQAYKLAILLNEHSERLRFIIPAYAKSAATLMALAGDEIFMAPAAELGPLDAQVPEEGETIETRSALDTASAIDDLVGIGLQVAALTNAEMLRSTSLSRAQVLGPALQFAAQIVEPLTSQLDPVKIHARRSLLDVAHKYAVDLMSRRRHVSNEQFHQIAFRLVNDYPTHGYVIDRREAHSLGLPVLPLENYEYYAEVNAIYLAFEEAIRNEPSNQVHVLHSTEVESWVRATLAPELIEPSTDHPNFGPPSPPPPYQGNGIQPDPAPGSETITADHGG